MTKILKYLGMVLLFLFVLTGCERKVPFKETTEEMAIEIAKLDVVEYLIEEIIGEDIEEMDILEVVVEVVTGEPMIMEVDIVGTLNTDFEDGTRVVKCTWYYYYENEVSRLQTVYAYCTGRDCAYITEEIYDNYLETKEELQ